MTRDVSSRLTTLVGGGMVRTLAILMLIAPAGGVAQETPEIVPGQSVSGALGPGDPTQYGRAYDDYRYSAAPGAEARVVVRSAEMAADVNIYFYDDYYDFIPLIVGGPAAKDSLDFTVPEVDSPTLVVIRVTTFADESRPSTGAYTIELSERRDPREPPGR